MAISLKKGQGVSLRKSEFDLSSLTIGLGWDVASEKKGFFKKLFSGDESDYDLNAIAFLRDGISGTVAFAQYCSIVFAKVVRKDGGWEFRALGEPHETDRFTDLLLSYVYV
ncbi:MAG: TerD domain-containing protein [Azoarcus sp.]|jgi:stress response protein SCP2|nr:TerD domain-containing protein [Azoarcus sp.]